MRCILAFCLLLLSLWGGAFSAFAQQNADEDRFKLANGYYQEAEYSKAIALYEGLAKDPAALPFIHRNYLDALRRTGQRKEMGRYLKRILKVDAYNPTFQVDYVRYLMSEEDSASGNKYLQQFVGEVNRDVVLLKRIADELIDHSLYTQAEYCYQEGDKRNKDAFKHEMARLYDAWGKKRQMLDLYLEILAQEPDQLDFVQTSLQDRLQKEEEFAMLEQTLLKYIQRNPDNVVYSEMLLWFYLQKKDFYKAFLQARGIDRRKQAEGFRIMEVGMLALESEDYPNAIRIFDHLVEKYTGQQVNLVARKQRIRARELQVRNTYPVNLQDIRTLVGDYQRLLRESSQRQVVADAMRNMALLQAFYLSEQDSAIASLEQLTQLRDLPRDLLAQCKLDLGDIYMMRKEPWEATLLYAQVEKSEKETPIGHEAKLRNAKLNYYTGNFKLAQEHLDILKLATSREIANDAMALSILIKDNLSLDTTETAMKAFAEADLLVFQGQLEQAARRYEKILQAYPEHSITDEVLWQLANLELKLGHPRPAADYLERLLQGYATDLLGDDALFLLGKVLQEQLKEPDKAMQCFQRLMVEYKGSSYNVEARRRFRQLRGDQEGS